MKALNLAQPLIVIMIGIPGAGKSFFAKRFSDTFGAPVVSEDRIRYELFSQPQFTPDENDIVKRLREYQIEELLKTKRTFIVDGGCNVKAERLHIKQLIKQTDYDLLGVWVQTHEPTAQGRAMKRHPRREDDKYNPSLSAEQFTYFARRLTAPNRENHVVISGMQTYGTQAKAVLRRIAANREIEAHEAHKLENTAAFQQTRSVSTTRRSIILR